MNAPEIAAVVERMPAAAGGGIDSPRALALNVRDALERMILDGRLEPGARLNEIALARALGVSRGPVREAARALERTGLVTVILHRGAFVRTLTLDEAMDIYQVATLLFAFAAWHLATSLTAAQAMELRALVDDMDRAIAATDRDAYFALNVRFHGCIVAFARNREIEAAYLSYAKKLLLLRRRSFEPGVPHMAGSNAEHRRLLEAILAGDPELARRRAEEHGQAGRARLVAAIEQGPRTPQSARRR